jgi:hypothetical protein
VPGALPRAPTITIMRKLLLAALLALTALPAAALPFIENDYAKAVARARAKNIPIFAEAWAPW